MNIKSTQYLMKVISICFFLATYTVMTVAILMAKTSGWLVTLDFNYYNEGMLELVLFGFGWICMATWFILSEIQFRRERK